MKNFTLDAEPSELTLHLITLLAHSMPVLGRYDKDTTHSYA